MRPLVTCLMLTKWPERKAFLPDVLASFHAQGAVSRELLVVNEGAPIESRVPGVRVINTGPRHSLGAQRNLGLREAAGDYVVNWDDDDASLPRRLALQLEAARAGADYVFCRALWVADASLAPVCRVEGFFPGTSLVRREAALAVGGCEAIDLGEDASLHARLAAAGRPIATLPEALSLYRRHGQNVTGRNTWREACGVDEAGPRAGALAALASMRSTLPPSLQHPFVEAL